MVKEKRYDAAISYYDRLIKEAQSRPPAERFEADPVIFYRGKAHALAAKGDTDQAITTLRAALDILKQRRGIPSVLARGTEEASLHQGLAGLYERKHDTQAAARERALAEKARREGERAFDHMGAPLEGAAALALTALGQVAAALAYVLAALAVASVRRKREGRPPLRKIGWSLGEVVGTYALGFLLPLLTASAIAVALALASPAADVVWPLAGVGALVTLGLLALLVRRGLSRKAPPVGPADAAPQSWTAAERSRATAAFSGWVLLAAGILNTGFLVAGGMAAVFLSFVTLAR
jgi:hypothetical protein